jgi:hypothetical protein
MLWQNKLECFGLPITPNLDYIFAGKEGVLTTIKRSALKAALSFLKEDLGESVICVKRSSLLDH